jgi:pilus assembly protein CpaE
VATNTILILDVDPTATEALAAPLIAAGHGVTVLASADQALAVASGYRILVVAALEPGRDAVQVCRLVRAIPDLRNLAICVITPLDEVESRVKLFEAGADEVLLAPVDARELEARVDTLLVRFQRSSIVGQTALVAEAAARRRRRSIAVFSASGGVGTTTIAVNIALALAHRYPDRVAIIDLHWPFGQVATHLDLTPRQTLGQLTRDEAALRDPTLIRTYAEKHASGLSVFAAPGTWEPMGALGGEGAQLLLDTATLAYEAVVIDAGSAADDRTIAVLQRSDAVVLAVCPEIAALRALHSLADSLVLHAFDLDRAIFVLNHVFAREILKARDIETALGRPPAIDLPYDPILYVKAVNEGVPVVQGAPTSAPAEALTRLAAVAVGDPTPDEASARDTQPEPVVPDKRPAGRFGGILGRKS